VSTPELHLKTLFILNDDGRILSTREPGASRGPLFSLVCGATGCAWAVHVDPPPELAGELDHLAQQEPPTSDFRAAPVYADRYLSLLDGRPDPGQKTASQLRQFHGPAFAFSDSLAQTAGVVVVEDEQLLEQNFRGWKSGEIAAGRSPVLAIVEDGYPVSICFCARRSDIAAEAGLETAEAYRGRGFGPRVTAAWALANRASGRIPLYSTSWTNHASLAVARKLNLVAYASHWSLSD
jgi:hypothetical protein